MLENYIMHIVILVFIYMIIAVMQNLTIGNVGLLCLGNIAFYGIGAYASAVLTLNGISFLPAFVLAGVFGMLAALLMTYLMQRLKGDYYVLGTLAFLFVVQSFFLNWTDVTRGALGLPGIPKPEVFGFVFDTLPEYLILTFAFALVSIMLVYLIQKSPLNLVLGSIRDDVTTSSVLGYNTFKIKMQVMAIVGFFTGLAGSLYAHYITFIDPSSFLLVEVILILTIVIVGGLGSLKGSVFGTVLLLLLPEVLRFLDLPSSMIGPLRQIFFSLILIFIIYFRPKGIFGEVEL